MVRTNEYEPDYVSPPGETLLELLHSLDMSQADLARRTGRPLKTVNEIIKGRTAITPETALQFEKVLKVPASFWNNREKQYREHLAKVHEQKDLKESLDWLKNFPISQMIKAGWMEQKTSRIGQLEALLEFFGIAHPRQYAKVCENQLLTDFRRSKAFTSDHYALNAWLRQGEILAQTLECSAFDHRAFRDNLNAIRQLTNESPEEFVPHMTALCQQSGAAVVFVKDIKGTVASGATRWLRPKKPLIQLGLRYKTNDHLWFTFFHEAGHILLHGKTRCFIEGANVKDQFEAEADKFASDFLIPETELRHFVRLGRISRDSVKEFAARVNIAPGVVVGRLQHDNVLKYSQLNDLKVKCC